MISSSQQSIAQDQICKYRKWAENPKKFDKLVSAVQDEAKKALVWQALTSDYWMRANRDPAVKVALELEPNSKSCQVFREIFSQAKINSGFLLNQNFFDAIQKGDFDRGKWVIEMGLDPQKNYYNGLSPFEALADGYLKWKQSFSYDPTDRNYHKSAFALLERLSKWRITLGQSEKFVPALFELIYESWECSGKPKSLQEALLSLAICMVEKKLYINDTLSQLDALFLKFRTILFSDGIADSPHFSNFCTRIFKFEDRYDSSFERIAIEASVKGILPPLRKLVVQMNMSWDKALTILCCYGSPSLESCSALLDSFQDSFDRPELKDFCWTQESKTQLPIFQEFLPDQKLRLTFIEVAIIGGNRELIEELLSKNVLDPNWESPTSGRSLLMLSALLDRPDIVELLMAKGAKVDLANRDGKEAVDYAQAGCWSRALIVSKMLGTKEKITLGGQDFHWEGGIRAQIGNFYPRYMMEDGNLLSERFRLLPMRWRSLCFSSMLCLEKTTFQNLFFHHHLQHLGEYVKHCYDETIWQPLCKFFLEIYSKKLILIQSYNIRHFAKNNPKFLKLFILEFINNSKDFSCKNLRDLNEMMEINWSEKLSSGENLLAYLIRKDLLVTNEVVNLSIYKPDVWRGDNDFTFRLLLQKLQQPVMQQIFYNCFCRLGSVWDNLCDKYSTEIFRIFEAYPFMFENPSLPLGVGQKLFPQLIQLALKRGVDTKVVAKIMVVYCFTRGYVNLLKVEVRKIFSTNESVVEELIKYFLENKPQEYIKLKNTAFLERDDLYQGIPLLVHLLRQKVDISPLESLWNLDKIESWMTCDCMAIKTILAEKLDVPVLKKLNPAELAKLLMKVDPNLALDLAVNWEHDKLIAELIELDCPFNKKNFCGKNELFLKVIFQLSLDKRRPFLPQIVYLDHVVLKKHQPSSELIQQILTDLPKESIPDPFYSYLIEGYSPNFLLAIIKDIPIHLQIGVLQQSLSVLDKKTYGNNRQLWIDLLHQSMLLCDFTSDFLDEKIPHYLNYLTNEKIMEQLSKKEFGTKFAHILAEVLHQNEANISLWCETFAKVGLHPLYTHKKLTVLERVFKCIGDDVYRFAPFWRVLEAKGYDFSVLKSLPLYKLKHNSPLINFLFRRFPAEVTSWFYEFYQKNSLFYARCTGIYPLIERVVEGADLNVVVDNKTTLELACIQNSLRFVRLLLSKGANPNLGRPLFEQYKSNNQSDPKIVSLLLEYGANLERELKNFSASFFEGVNCKQLFQLLRCHIPLDLLKKIRLRDSRVDDFLTKVTSLEASKLLHSCILSDNVGLLQLFLKLPYKKLSSAEVCVGISKARCEKRLLIATILLEHFPECLAKITPEERDFVKPYFENIKPFIPNSESIFWINHQPVLYEYLPQNTVLLMIDDECKNLKAFYKHSESIPWQEVFGPDVGAKCQEALACVERKSYELDFFNFEDYPLPPPEPLPPIPSGRSLSELETFLYAENKTLPTHLEPLKGKLVLYRERIQKREGISLMSQEEYQSLEHCILLIIDELHKEKDFIVKLTALRELSLGVGYCNGRILTDALYIYKMLAGHFTKSVKDEKGLSTLLSQIMHDFLFGVIDEEVSSDPQSIHSRNLAAFGFKRLYGIEAPPIFSINYGDHHMYTAKWNQDNCFQLVDNCKKKLEEIPLVRFAERLNRIMQQEGGGKLMSELSTVLLSCVKESQLSLQQQQSLHQLEAPHLKKVNSLKKGIAETKELLNKIPAETKKCSLELDCQLNELKKLEELKSLGFTKIEIEQKIKLIQEKLSKETNALVQSALKKQIESLKSLEPQDAEQQELSHKIVAIKEKIAKLSNSPKILELQRLERILSKHEDALHQENEAFNNAKGQILEPILKSLGWLYIDQDKPVLSPWGTLQILIYFGWLQER
jgi:ankyrin repeat protein